MFVPTPIDKNFVPYTKRPVLKRNAGLFVGAGGKGRGASRAILQQSTGLECGGKPDCVTSCGPYAVCVKGSCVPIELSGCSL